MIDIEHVTMDFKIQNDNMKSLKAYIVRKLKGEITYNQFRALEDINLSIPKGQVCGIIGTNGAGKSTLLKLISGVLTPSEGKITAKGNIAPMLELGAGFDHDLSGTENIYLNGAILGYSKQFLDEKYKEIVEFSELGAFIEQPLRTYSSGMIMRLAFSIATLVNPDILIVDEILSVGDAHFTKKSGERMKHLMGSGTTVVMVSHDINQIETMCDRAIWLEKGRVVMDGNAQEVCEKYKEKVL